ncbi:hypothetical protein EVAR_96461_1 [Eumeta japonica]|uniref:Uncharacterized protein n=1 Tax=Eumeta variegata TaxID=151549 RepID=A0A4C1VYF8_EUMVA|nr:hypothetical protein EVAR_96461_1 [Eumeta japonica]
MIALQWREISTRGRRRKGRGALNLSIASFQGGSFVRCTVSSVSKTTRLTNEHHRLVPGRVSKLKTGRGTESRARDRTRSEIENETGLKIDCGIGIRIEIQKMKELFALAFVQIRTVNGSGITIESGTGNRIENGNRVTIESGTEIENGTEVENEFGIGIRIKTVTAIGIEIDSETGLEI